MDTFYDREKLYEEVWKESMVTVSKRYGMSDRGLAKICIKLKVPYPSVGYWAKKEAGKAPPRPELPTFDNPPKFSIRTMGEKSEIKKEGILVPDIFIQAQELIEKESFPDMFITVPQSTVKEHLYVKNTRLNLEKNKGADEFRFYGRIKTWGKDIFSVNVGPASITRAVGILQALCDACEKRRFPIVSTWNEQQRDGKISIKILDESISFSIIEPASKSKKEVKDKYSHEQYEYIPSGRLSLQIENSPWGDEGQKRWSDTKKQLLEEKLNDIMAGLILTAAWEKESAARHKKRDEEWKHEQEAKKEKERLARIETQRVLNFEEGSEYWKHCHDLATFLDVVKNYYQEKIKKGESDEDLSKWIIWAEQYLSRHYGIPTKCIVYDVKDPGEHAFSQDPFEEIKMRIRGEGDKDNDYWRRKNLYDKFRRGY